MTARARALAARCRKYGLTPDQFRAMARMKKGCWVCGKTRRKDGRPRRLNIDHDHSDGRVRGLLCFKCNKYLVGKHRNGRLLASAAAYLESTFDGRKIAA